MKKVLFLVPHLSTGGMPQYTYTLMKKIQGDVDVYCVEYSMISSHFVVQRNRISELLGDKFFSLGNNKEDLFALIDTINPDIIHLQEIPEYFLSEEIARRLYKDDRSYLIVETSHDSSFSSSNKRFFPDHFGLISQYQKNEFSKLGIPIDFIEADIEYKERQDRNTGLQKLGLDPSIKHVLNVGLFTPRKNQAEAIEYARSLEGYPIQFHFIGNQADNFADYWTPLINNLPSNVKIWGERSDVDDFYSCMDMMLFTSRGTGNDKETSPLVIREAIGYNLTSLIFNLPVYLGMYDKYECINYMDFDDKEYNTNLIKDILGIDQNTDFSNKLHTLNGIVDFDGVEIKDTMYETIQVSGEAAGMWWGAFVHKELDRGDVKIEKGDTFVDLGANIGISSHYAIKHGASKVYCFEPDPNVLSLLNKNIKLNHLEFNYAISNKRENIELFHWPHNPINVGPKYNVQSITLDDVFQLVNQPIIDYLKVDIEGFEETVFDDVSEHVIRGIRKMFIEHHYPENTERFVQKIQDLGFTVYVEYGYGQNYIYCLNKNVKPHFNDKSADVSINQDDLVNMWFESDQNKIHIHYLGENELDCKISVKDADSNVPIYWFKTKFTKDSKYWVIPTPKRIYDFSSDQTFRSFRIEFYNLMDDMLFYKDLSIRESSLKRTVRINLSNPFDCIFFNYNEMFVTGHYDCYGISGVETVLDIGANNGLFARYLLENGCKNLYLFEPNKNATKNISSVLEDFNDYELIEKAVGVNDEDIKFYISTDNTTIGSISKSHVENHARSVEINIPAISLSTFIKERGITKIGLIKMDIESAEYDIIENLDSDVFEMTDSFLIEFHDNDGTNVTKLIEKIKGYGFRLDQIRDQSSVSNPDITDSYKTRLNGTIYLTKSPKRILHKIKAVQFLLNGNHEKQDMSIENLSSLEEYGIVYHKQYNDVYTDLPPISKSARPRDVSIELKPNSLTPAHYGCYDSFRTAVLSEFDSDLDYLLVFEGDAKIQNKEVFMSKLQESIELIDKYKLDYVSFGGIYDLEHGVLQSNVVENMTEDFFVCDKIIGCQCILFPKNSRNKIKEILRTEPWDALDIYLNKVSSKHGLRVGVSRKTLVTQYDGISTIDNVVKQFKEFSL